MKHHDSGRAAVSMALLLGLFGLLGCSEQASSDGPVGTGGNGGSAVPGNPSGMPTNNTTGINSAQTAGSGAGPGGGPGGAQGGAQGDGAMSGTPMGAAGNGVQGTGGAMGGAMTNPMAGNTPGPMGGAMTNPMAGDAPGPMAGDMMGDPTTGPMPGMMTGTGQDPTLAPTFTAIFENILTNGMTGNCMANFCHGGAPNPVANGSLQIPFDDKDVAHANLVGVASSSDMCAGMTLVVPGDSANSLLVQKLAESPPCGVRMPVGPPLTEAQVNQITTWIDMGAPNN